MIEVTNLSKSYGSTQALRGVSFRVESGEIIGLLGPNSAGKTTMMRVLTGFLQPDEGQVTVDGLDVLADTLEVQKRIGYLPENAPLYPELSVQAYLKMMGRPAPDSGCRTAGAPLRSRPRHSPDRPPHPPHWRAQQGVSPASRSGPGHSAPAETADLRCAHGQPGPHPDRRGAAIDPTAGQSQHRSPLHPHPL